MLLVSVILCSIQSLDLADHIAYCITTGALVDPDRESINVIIILPSDFGLWSSESFFWLIESLI